MAGAWALVRSFEDEISAEAFAGHLRAEEVPAEVVVRSDLPGLINDVEVKVPTSLVHRARFVLNSLKPTRMIPRLLLTGYLILIMSTPNSAAGSDTWVLLEYEKDGLPIVMKVMEDLPPATVRDGFEWLTVISWKYDASENNGMPVPEANNQMIQLESSIDILQENELCVHVYSKTGNGQKELVYYIGDRDEFMQAFSQALADQPVYPLEIEFFEDPEWGDLQTVHRVYLQKE